MLTHHLNRANEILRHIDLPEVAASDLAASSGFFELYRVPRKAQWETSARASLDFHGVGQANTGPAGDPCEPGDTKQDLPFALVSRR